MDLNNIPKQFCENVLTAHSQESFTLVMTAGDTASAYALTPQHAKRLLKSLEHQITEYEKQFGAIDADWSPGIKSPIQTKDIEEK